MNNILFKVKLFYIKIFIINRIKRRLPVKLYNKRNKGLCGVVALYLYEKLINYKPIFLVINNYVTNDSHVLLQIIVHGTPIYIDHKSIFYSKGDNNIKYLDKNSLIGI